MKKIMAVALAFVLTMTSFFGSCTENSNVSKAATEVKYERETIFNGEGFSVKYVIQSQWEDQYIANVYITNTGEKTIENWELAYESLDEITNIWNASITYHAAKNYNIKNAEHNQNIKPGATISFGFQASFTGNEIQPPRTYKILGNEMVVNNNDCKVSFNIQSSWNTGCIMEVTIFNNSDENIEDWSMKFDFPYTIQNIWRSKITSQEGVNYNLKNLEYNSIIRPGESETFGMQVGFSEDTLVQYPTNVVLSQYKKDKWYLDFDKEWNRTMIHADSAEFVAASNKNKGKIKIAMLDSGIDYSSNINVVEDEDFVEDYDDMSILFSDLSGHGTAIAGVLGSSSTVSSESFTYSNEYMNIVMNEKIDGVNPYVDIYSARILDDNNETTVSRLVEGIQWAIEKDVNIINISCGVDSGSSKLHTAIKEAYNKGILIIAAAGDSSGVKYPAKYAEVMAVGAVKCNGKLSAESPIGEEIEVVAPGEDVTSYGPFGMINNFSGTSIAAPQVTALASVLWQQDVSKDANFIRGLIKATARPLGSKLKFGEGLIDCSYALSQYETYASSIQKASVDSAFPETEGNESNVETNNSEIIKYEEDVVKGYWGGKKHIEMAKKMSIVQDGVVWPDKKKSKINGMTDNPLFHGYYKGNYINAYKKITWIASKMYKTGKFPSSNDKVTKGIIADIKKATKKNGFTKYACTTKEQKALFIYGMAMHTTADIFAHSASAVRWTKINQSKKKKKKNVSIKKLKKQWKKLTHGKRQANGKFSKNLNFADNTTYITNRVNSARNVCSSMLNTCVTKKTKGSINVFKNVKYYASKGTASKYKSKSKKKKYLKNSYSIFNLSTYLKPTEVKGKNRKKLKKVVNSVANNKVKKIFEKW